MSIINSPKTDPNKILPMRYQWARNHYKDGVNNNWTPEEISMQKDVEQWKSDREISPAERRLILWNLGFFSTAESLTAEHHNESMLLDRLHEEIGPLQGDVS